MGEIRHESVIRRDGFHRHFLEQLESVGGKEAVYVERKHRVSENGIRVQETEPKRERVENGGKRRGVRRKREGFGE